MLDKYKRMIWIAAGLYIGTAIGGNIAYHTNEFRDATAKSRIVDPLLKQKWVDYAEAEMMALYNPKMLIPFSFCINRNPRPPEIEVRVFDSGDPDDLEEENAPKQEKPKRSLDDDMNFI